MNLMPTELFIRRPLLWMTDRSRKAGDDPVLAELRLSPLPQGARRSSPGDLDLSSVRLIFNGAEPISVELCEEFMARLAPAGLKRTAMYPVYGLAEATLVVSFPHRSAARCTRIRQSSQARRRRQRRGRSPRSEPRRTGAHGSVGKADSATATCASLTMTIGRLPDGHVGHILIRGENVTEGLLRESGGERGKGFTADGWLRTGDLGNDDGRRDSTSPAAPRRSSSSMARTTIRTTSRASRQRAEGMELGKVVVAGVRPPGAETDDLTVFALHRVRHEGVSCPSQPQITRLVNEQRRPRSRAGRAGQAHPENHQRQDPAPPAGRELHRR